MSDLSQTYDDNANRDAPMEVVMADYIRACESGNPPDRQQILDAHPDQASELKQFFAQRDQMARLVEPIRDFADHVFRTVGPGRQISYVGNYELLEEVARGGMGVVYKARQKLLGRIVAVKMILAGRLANEDDVKRFQIEAQAAASLQHPNIVPIHEVGSHQGLHYFSMDFIEGRSLSAILRENPLSARHAATYVQQMAEAIHYAHQQGTLHRDLKPSNILIDNRDQVRITDFGLAMRIEGDSDLTRTGQIVGTASYMPPEQAQGIRSLIGPGSDVYSLGAILYECLTGRAPFRADSAMKTIEQVIHVEAASPRFLNPGIARDLETICLKCLEKEPHRRYGTAQLLADDLGRFLRGDPIVARPISSSARLWRWGKRYPAVAALSVVSSVAVLAVSLAVVARAYNDQLQSVNVLLELANSQLKTANNRLEQTADELETTLQTVQDEKAEVIRQRTRATAAETKTRQLLYASTMVQVEQARQQQQPEVVMQLLRSVIPDNPDQDDPRGFEWYHLWRLYHGESSRLRGHKGAVLSVTFSPDDRLLASAGDDATIRLWDAITGKQIRILNGHTLRVMSVRFSPDGKSLVSAGADGNVKVWSTESGVELMSLVGHRSAATCVLFSPDGRYIVTGSEDRTIRVWDISTCRLVQIKSSDNPISGVAFSPDGRNLTYSTRTARGIESDSPSLMNRVDETDFRFINNGTLQTAVAYSPSGGHLATANESTKKNEQPSVVLTNLIGTQKKENLAMHAALITSLAFSPDGKWLASGSLDQTVKVWDVAARTEFHIYHEQAGVYSVGFSSDSLRLATASGDGIIKIWSLPGNDSRTVRCRGRVNNVAFSPNGGQLAGVSGGTILVWNANNCQELLRLEDNGSDSRARWSPDGRYLASNKRIWDAADGKLHKVVAYPPQRYNTSQVAFASSANLLAAAFIDQTVSPNILTFDIESGIVRDSFSMRNCASCIAISADEMWLAAGSCFAHSTKDTLLERSETMRIWSLKTGQPGISLEDAFYMSVWEVAFSPDGTQIAAAFGKHFARGEKRMKGEVVVWDVSTGVVLHRLRGHRSCVWSVAFSPDGTRLASASGDLYDGNSLGEVKIWDMNSGQNVCNLREITGTIFGVAFSPCGRRIATSSGDGTVTIFDGTPLAEPIFRDDQVNEN